jgi:hypothetical protein
MSRESALAKLQRVLGPEKAGEVIDGCIRSAGVRGLETPDDRLRFARELIRLGGIYDAIGNSIAVQSILEGAKEAKPTAVVDRDPAPRRR